MPEDTIATMVAAAADACPDRCAYSWLDHTGTITQSLTYGELASAVERRRQIIEQHTAVGDRVLLAASESLAFVETFFACVSSGRIAVPLPEPVGQRRMKRMTDVAADCTPSLVFANPDIVPSVRRALARGVKHEVAVLPSVSVSNGPLSCLQPHPSRSEQIALLQYTSGSTGQPKGVLITHANVVHNSRSIQQAFGHGTESRILLWVPLFHDMGLIGMLQSVAAHATCYLMAPASFHRDPLVWLRAIDAHLITTAGAPNSAYEQCVARIEERGKPHALNLSHWRVAFVGAEMVRPSTLERFSEKLAPFGFRRDAFRPCYGLAEATLMVTAGRTMRPSLTGVEAKQGGMAAGTPGARKPHLVGSGHALPGQRILILNQETDIPLSAGSIGEICVSGPNVSRGYWNISSNPVGGADKEFGEPMVRTGDLGFLRDGELFIVGRIKDIYIKDGLNIAAETIEACIAEVYELATARCVAFAIDNGDKESLVVVVEVNRTLIDLARIVTFVRDAVADAFAFEPSDVVLVRRGSIPLTTSGKPQRFLCKQAFQQGRLAVLLHDRLDASHAAALKAAIGDAPPAQPEIVRAISELISRLLAYSADEIMPNARLVDLGITSLTAMRLQHLLRSSFSVSVPLRKLLCAETVEGLASAVATAQSIKEASERWSDGACTPGVSMNQKALWLAYRRAPRSSLYNVPLCLRVLEHLDVVRLQTAFQTLFSSHSVLGITYVQDAMRDLIPVQLADVPAIVFKNVESMDRTDLRTLVAIDASKPFDLAQEASLRLHAYRRADDEYWILLTAHHIAIDLRSMEIIIRDLFVSYRRDLSDRQAVRGKTPAATFWHAVEEENRLLASVAGQNAIVSSRSNLLPSINLDGYHGDSSEAVEEGGRLQFQLGRPRSDALRTLAKSLGATCFVVMFAAMAATVHRLTGQSQFSLGIVDVGRRHEKYEEVVGYLAKIVSVLCSVKRGESLVDLVLRLRDEIIDALDRMPIPYAAIQSRDDSGDSAWATAFPDVFCVEETPTLLRGPAAEALAAGQEDYVGELLGLRVAPVVLERRSVEFPLILRFVVGSGGITGSLDFQARAHRPCFMEAFRQALIDVVDEMGQVAPFTRGHPRYSSFRPGPPDQSIPVAPEEMISRLALGSPQAPAIVDGGSSLCYADLWARVSEVAGAYAGAGLGPGKRLGLCVSDTTDFTVGSLAAMVVGTPFIPLPIDEPADRLQSMVRTSAPDLIAIAGPRIPPGIAELPCIDISAAATLASPRKMSASDVMSDARPAYAMWTSGSSGVPKGVLVSRESLACHLSAFCAYAHLRREDRVLRFSPTSFDAIIEEVFGTLMAGAAICSLSEIERLSLPSFTTFLEREGVTVMNIPTPFWEAWVEYLTSTGRALPKSLRLTIIGNAAIGRRSVQDWMRLSGAAAVSLVNAYGPTEATVTTTMFKVPRDVDSARDVPIGAPLDGKTVHVLDDDLLPVPPGSVGQLYIGGSGPALCYLSDPATSAARFLPNPFTNTPGARLFKTGDLVRLGPNGVLTYVGRVDNQVKLRGYRIEIEEVEAALRALPDVVAAAAVLRDAADGGAELAAGVVLRASGASTSIQLRRAVKRRLPSHMIPADIVIFDQMPVTRTGKVDRVAVMQCLQPRSNEVPQGFDETRTSVEEALHRVWSEILKRETIGLEQNFFELGGHSLTGTRILARISHALEIELPLLTIFEHPTIADLARHIEALLDASDGRTGISEDMRLGHATKGVRNAQ
ncbi:non-ribosomal peptide synthetase [Bradyrhizobium sp. SZCCHNR1015]|uniref:non-ribosomal peptide synthetase n=1 Tax=Bradyrhizobium sp. SZCCHNR1015 TaxID=3057338 RepID=UPI0029169414|nr:non-ribosomal peptide synthetase [Bradyrhizobium sp. SZCCHNR1015]